MGGVIMKASKGAFESSLRREGSSEHGEPILIGKMQALRNIWSYLLLLVC